MPGLRIQNTLLYGGSAVLKILLRAGIALLLAAVFSDDVAALIQPFYPVGELSVFVISYALLLLLFIKPSFISNMVEWWKSSSLKTHHYNEDWLDPFPPADERMTPEVIYDPFQHRFKLKDEP